jgi:membrane protease YdiL (CAAX protease family)
MDLVQVVAWAYSLVILVFTLGFLVNWFRNREAMAPYRRVGFWAGIIFVSFELLTLALSPGAFFGFVNMCLTVALLGWGILRVWGFVNNGIFFSNQLNIRSFPLIAPHLGVPPAPAEPPAVVPVTAPLAEGSIATPDIPIETVVLPPMPIEPAAPPAIDWRRYWLHTTGVALAAVAYSAVLFLVTKPGPGLIAQSTNLSDAQIVTPLTLVIILEFAFVEELIFRLAIQNYLGAKLIKRRYGYGAAIVITAALWSLAHVGSLNPDGVKLAQIFPLGLALGWLYRRQGTESTIMTHALFNVIGGLVLSPLYLR